MAEAGELNAKIKEQPNLLGYEAKMEAVPVEFYYFEQ